MSISLILMPLAIAGVTAVQAALPKKEQEGVQDATVCQVQTRMKDPALLTEALRETRADVAVLPDSIVARWQGVEGIFERDEQGIWQAHFTGDVDVERASQIVAAVDTAYGRQVQQAVLARLRQRAPDAGLSVASEKVEDDDSVTLVLNVGARA